MLNQPTTDLMREMRLYGMAEAWEAQQADPQYQGLSTEERLALLLDSERLERENRRLRRLLRAAKLRITNASIEDLECSEERGLSSAFVRQLATGRYLAEAHNLLATGKTGTGKTFAACALGHHACRQGHSTLYRRLSLLLDELMRARADGTYPRLLRALTKTQLLIIDDWGLTPLTDAGRRDLLELFDARYKRVSTVITSQLEVKHWHEYIGEATIADAILDRLVHNAFRLELKGPSRR